MSGFDYGARAYKNGKPQPDRVNANIKPSDDHRRRASKLPREVVIGERTGSVAGDAVLGDGPVYVSFTKCTVSVWYGDAVVMEAMSDSERLIGSHFVTIRYNEDTNHAHVELRHEDGTVWHGFGGYGPPVAECEAYMRALWPEQLWRIA